MSWRAASSALLLLLTITASPLHGQSGTADALFAAGDYAQAAAAARAEASSAGRAGAATAERWLLAAKANERAEGSFADSEAALRAAAAAFGTTGIPSRMRVRIAAIRALSQSRAGDFETAARTILEARSTPRKTQSSEEEIELDLSYGIVLLRMNLPAVAIEVLGEVCKARLQLPDGDARLLEALHWLGVAQLKGQRPAQAATTLAEVVRVRTLALGAEHRDTLASRAVLASALNSGSAGEPARERAEVLARWRARANPRDAAWLADAMRAASIDVSDAEERISALRTAYRIASQAGPAVQRIIAETGVDLAKALQRAGRPGEALAVLTDAASRSPEMARTRLGDELQVALAVVYETLDRVTEAKTIYRTMIAAYDADPTRNRADRLTLINNYAELMAREGSFLPALALAREVAQGRERLLGPTAPPTLSAKSALASYLSRTGHAQDAIALHREVLSARLIAVPRDEQAIANSLHNLGAALDEAGLRSEALNYAGQAVSVRLRVLGEAHPDTITSLRLLAGVRVATGDRAGAIAAYRASVAGLERGRLVAVSGDGQRRSWFRQFAQVYKMLAFLEAAANNSGALDYVDAVHGRTLAELSESRAVIGAVASAQDAARLDAARAAVGALAARDISALDDAARAQHGAALDQATTRLAEFEAGLEERYPALRFAKPAGALSRSRIRAAIGPDASMLSFAVLGDRVLRITITPDDAVEASEREVPSLQETVRSWLALLSAKAVAGSAADPLRDRAVYAWPDGSFRIKKLADDVPEEAIIVNDAEIVRRALSKALLGDMPETVHRSTRWVVSPDGPLAALPFDALEIEGRLVLDRTSVSYTPSIRMLLRLHDRRNEYQRGTREPMLVLGAPAFSTAAAGSPLRLWQELPGSAAETAALQDRFGLVEGTNLFTGSAATEARLRALDASGALGRARMVVLSTHGLVDVASAERNAVVLLGSGSDSASDGPVRAAELISLRFGADLVVVSACQSAVGEWVDGEGAMGLPFALFAAGSASTLLTHWPIADNGSAAFIDRFFAKLQAGERASQALRQTKKDLAAGLAGARLRDPAYWAAFSLYGAD